MIIKKLFYTFVIFSFLTANSWSAGSSSSDSSSSKSDYDKAVNNMNELIAEGERNGFSYENMLTNPRSPNYILNDVVNVYKSRIDDASFKALEGQINGMRNTMSTSMQGDVEKFKTLVSGSTPEVEVRLRNWYPEN